MRADIQINIVVFDGFDELDALAPLEVFRTASHLGADVHAQLVTRDSQTTVTGAHGLQCIPDGVYESGADIVIIPGGGWIARADAGVWGEVQRGDWLPILTEAAASGAVMASVCTGAMLLAHANVIGERRATTHTSAWADLEATGATLVQERVVDEGSLVTCGGVTSGLDMALWLVERFTSPAVAETVATHLEYEPVRPCQSDHASLGTD